jgi:biotin carboxyl carrier protein
MTFDVEVGETLRTVTVHRKGLMLHVEIGGRTHIVDARRVGDAVLSMLVSTCEGTAAVRSVDAAFAARPGPQRGSRAGVGPRPQRGSRAGVDRTPGAFDVHLAGRTIPVQIRQAGAFGRQKREGSGAHLSTTLGAGGAGPQRVVAPMPGKIVRVLVKTGDEVKARQALVVVEAMKMENELRATREGRVREVAVAEGQSVDAGAVLMVVE